MIPIPRNTLVLCRMLEVKERLHGSLVIPTNSDLYCEAEIVAFGPGNVNATGARPETHDLRVGQRVLVKHQKIREAGGGLIKNKEGIEYERDGQKYMIFEQGNVLAILSQVEVVGGPNNNL